MSVSAVSDILVSSDEEADIFDQDAGSPTHDISYEGTLSKWTNYLHGWQSRYLILRDGTLSYYKSEFDTGYGSRGSVSVTKALIEVHEFDNCRFDVNVGDCIYYLRAPDPDERQRWVDVLEASKQAESGYGSEPHLPKAISSLSLTSQPSLHSTNSSQKSSGLREKLLEMETFRDILCRQTDTLQAYFDSCAEKHGNSLQHENIDMKDDEIDDIDELSATPTPSNMQFVKSTNISSNNASIDFRGEAITFKATTAGVIQILSHCIELMTKREDYWKQKCEREKEKSRKLAEKVKEYEEQVKNRTQSQFLNGPDYVEGPHSKLNEEEFFDAVDTALDEEDAKEYIEEISNETISSKTVTDSSGTPIHRYSKEVERTVKENLLLLKENVDEEGSGWDTVYVDGDMKVYRKEFEENGVVCDPLKASCIIPGVTGKECCYYFFDKEYRLDWEVSVEKVKIVEKLCDNTMIFHQIHKRIWPAAQRDNCFISHMKCLGKDEVDRLDKEIGSAWTVTNFPHDVESERDNKYVRVIANVIMVCQTFTTGEVKKKKYTRENIATKLSYMAQVNPGGWAPPAAVRQIAKREYPKFLRKFSAFVQKITKDKPLML